LQTTARSHDENSIQREGVRRPASNFAEQDRWLDAGYGTRWLEDRRLASAVRDSMLYFAGTRYELLAYVVMPSHVHWVFRPLPAWVAERAAQGDRRTAREIILHSFCRHTAVVWNRLRQRSGGLWQRESYDRVVRNDDELKRIVEYVEFNPVKAGLCQRSDEWEFSSAWAGRLGSPRDEA